MPAGLYPAVNLPERQSDAKRSDHAAGRVIYLAVAIACHAASAVNLQVQTSNCCRNLELPSAWARGSTMGQGNDPSSLCPIVRHVPRNLRVDGLGWLKTGWRCY